MLITCSYREKEFVRIGYYVNNEYVECLLGGVGWGGVVWLPP